MNYYTCGAKGYWGDKKVYALANYNCIKVLNNDEETIYIEQDMVDLNYAYYNIICYLDKIFFIPYNTRSITEHFIANLLSIEASTVFPNVGNYSVILSWRKPTFQNLFVPLCNFLLTHHHFVWRS